MLQSVHVPLVSSLMKGCWVFCRQEAIETFKEALKLKSDFIDAYKSLGQAYRYSHICYSLVTFYNVTIFTQHTNTICSFCISIIKSTCLSPLSH